MRHSILAPAGRSFLVAASVLVSGCSNAGAPTAPTTDPNPVPTPSRGVASTLAATACVREGNMEVTLRWNGGFFLEPLHVALVFKQKRGSITVNHTVSEAVVLTWGGYPRPVTFTLSTVPAQVNSVSWDQFFSIGASTTGAFFANATPVRQPSGGWKNC